MAGYDPKRRTREDEIRDHLVGFTVEEVRVLDATAYLRLTKPGAEDRYAGVDAESVSDASSVWPALP